MLESLLFDLVGANGIHERHEGVAFFAMAKTLHPIRSIYYIGINIPIGAQPKGYMHCTYSDRWMKYCGGREPVGEQRIAAIAPLFSGPVDWSDPQDSASAEDPGLLAAWMRGQRLLSFPLRSVADEQAVFCVATEQGRYGSSSLLREFQTLGNYFHQHILRIHGHGSEAAGLVSARELDCLKWAAAGKTAWESSVILGISERTVRFHLNAAREKLNCLTTTQAVAKAVSQQMI